MKPRVSEIAHGVYRISTFHEGFQLEFNQFIVNDEEPFLMHTGMRQMFPSTKAGVAEVIDPTKVRWIGFSHFESDECGALNDWLALAPEATTVCSVTGLSRRSGRAISSPGLAARASLMTHRLCAYGL